MFNQCKSRANDFYENENINGENNLSNTLIYKTREHLIKDLEGIFLEIQWDRRTIIVSTEEDFLDFTRLEMPSINFGQYS
ncbi:hypothetical protein KO488_12640 [Poseidonibacter lekithochrous]|uniref:hypothetical protein n=1 Tax=Poseidonibacter TaxID=2321187 RepID=UPI001C0839EA|nr:MULTISPECIES: hypothetical protein [Poseidonibacter]MBU3015609.1 hypothetical protein [Poseidonibacter lekithochrous]MDO6828909.1 hypothetical protein [Poseidonibacter sp. 1_MG-2023]